MSRNEIKSGIMFAKDCSAHADAVCFDVDSTIITTEGIDCLADYCNVKQEVADLTKGAMEGKMDFRESFAARLSIIQPTSRMIQNFLATHQLPFTSSVEELIHELHRQGKHVYLISGGIRNMIAPIAETLRIPHSRVYCNSLLFDENTGAYCGFDCEEPTSSDQGKARVISSLKEAYGYQKVVHIGDGSTDLQTKPVVEAFIGFGGVVVRPAVQNHADCDWFVTDFKDLLDSLKGKDKDKNKTVSL